MPYSNIVTAVLFGQLPFQAPPFNLDTLSAVLLELPVPIVEWAYLARLEPSGDAVEVEGVVANAPGYSALLARG